MSELEPVPEDWERGLVVVAHPDDMEYGGASAVARWTDQGKDIRYLLVTEGEAGIDSMPPEQCAPVRRAEQVASCRAVGVEVVEFLDHPDGLVQPGLDLRRDLAAAIRRHRPEVVISINFRESFGGPAFNHADHRIVGEALLDATRDAANRWLFPDAGEPHQGVRLALFSGSPRSTHGVDVGDWLDAGVASLACHEAYLAELGSDMADPDTFLRGMAEQTGPRLGVRYAVGFELFEV